MKKTNTASAAIKKLYTKIKTTATQLEKMLEQFDKLRSKADTKTAAKTKTSKASKTSKTTKAVKPSKTKAKTSKTSKSATAKPAATAKRRGRPSKN